MIYREMLEIETQKGVSFTNITDRINEMLSRCVLKNGICNIFLTSTTSGLILNEDERMLLGDLTRHYDQMAEEGRLYNHASNAFAHIRATSAKQELTLPVSQGHLMLGQWQSIILCEFDNEPRKRTLIVTMLTGGTA